MKKLFIAFIALLISFSLFAQDWERDYDFEEILLEEWDVEVWTVLDDGVWRINFEDFSSSSWDNVYYNLAFTLAAFEDILYNNDVDFNETNVEVFIFSWFEEFDPDDPYNEETNLRWDIWMDYSWLNEYFDSRFSEQFEMIDTVISPVYEEWIGQQEQLNYFNRKR